MGKGSALTKTGIGNTPEAAQYQDSPQATVAAFGKQSLAPENHMDFGPASIPMLEETTFGSQSADQAPQSPAFFKQTQQGNTPKFQKPSFQETENNPDLARKADTKGGKLLNFFLSVANGGAAGAGQPTLGGGFLMAQHAGMQRQQAAQEQKQTAFENQRQTAADQRAQTEEDRRQRESVASIGKDEALTAESKARTNNKDLNPQQIIELKKAEAQSAGFKQGSPEYNEYVYAIKPTKDSTPSAYGDFRGGYPDTPQGRQQAARDWNAQIHRQPGARAASHADQVAEAEDIASAFLDHAKGDVNQAMADFTKAGSSVKDKRQLALAPHIRRAIRESRRVQNADPLAGLLNNNSPQQP